VDQLELDNIDQDVREAVSQLIIGLITVQEFTAWVSLINERFPTDLTLLHGLTDPRTGLKYINEPGQAN